MLVDWGQQPPGEGKTPISHLGLAGHGELRFAREISHRIAFLSKGQITEIGPPAELLDNPQDPALKEFLRHVR